MPAQAKTVPAPRKSFGVPQVCSNPAKPGGGDDGLRPKAAPAPAPKAVSATVLWDQPLSTVNQNAYVDQDFSDLPTYSSYLADDFINETSWNIGTIFVPGDGWNGFTTLMNATSLTWAIYADQGVLPSGPISMMGIPDGYPGGGNAPYWTITLPPTDPQVAITTGTGGYPSNTTLTLTTPISLPPGAWWLYFYPTLNFASYGQFGRQPSDTTNGGMAQFINPGGGFGLGTGLQNWNILDPVGLTQHDLAFRLEDAGCVETVQDGSFEAGSPNPYWAEYSTNFGTPLCTVSGCGTGTGTGPRTGSWWAWFGGIAAWEDGSVAQSIVIPVGTATLNYYTEFPVCSGVAGDYLDVSLDGTRIARYTAQDATCGTVGYVLRTHDVTAYADGSAHTLSFHSNISSGVTSNFFVDDISLVSCVNPCSTIYVYPYTLPTPTVGVPYTLQFWAYGGTEPYTFAVTAGALPPGLTLAADGTLSGTLLSLGDFSFTVTATDANGCTGEQSYSMATWSAYFLDDQGRSKLCVNRLTGDYIWEITTGPGMGTYTGVANILNGGTKIYSKPGAEDYLNCTYDAIKKRAAGYYITAAGDYSALKDYNTTNNEGGCFGGEQNPD